MNGLLLVEAGRTASLCPQATTMTVEGGDRMARGEGANAFRRGVMGGKKCLRGGCGGRRGGRRRGLLSVR